MSRPRTKDGREDGKFPVAIQASITKEDGELLNEVAATEERPVSFIVRTALMRYLPQWNRNTEGDQ